MRHYKDKALVQEELGQSLELIEEFTEPQVISEPKILSPKGSVPLDLAAEGRLRARCGGSNLASPISFSPIDSSHRDQP